MFEYKLSAGGTVTINPRYIVAISTYQCNVGQCCIDVVNGDSWIVEEHYDVVNEHYGNWLARCGGG